MTYELADFRPDDGHLHTCPEDLLEARACDCAAHLYALAARPSLRDWQANAAHWTDTRIPGDSLEWRGLVLGEETGEVVEAAVALAIASAKAQRAILKAQEGIRGDYDYWLAELRKETADTFFCLAALAHRARFDLGDAVAERWVVLDARTYETERQPRPVASVES